METAEKLIRDQLKNLLDQAEKNIKLQKIFNEMIDSSLKGLVHVATFSEGCLTVIADNASIATRLRFVENELISQLRSFSEFKTIQKIKCKVRPTSAEAPTKTVERHISSDNAQLLKQASEHIKDERIKKALENIAKHGS